MERLDLHTPRNRQVPVSAQHLKLGGFLRILLMGRVATDPQALHTPPLPNAAFSGSVSE